MGGKSGNVNKVSGMGSLSGSQSTGFITPEKGSSSNMGSFKPISETGNFQKPLGTDNYSQTQGTGSFNKPQTMGGLSDVQGSGNSFSTQGTGNLNKPLNGNAVIAPAKENLSKTPESGNVVVSPGSETQAEIPEVIIVGNDTLAAGNSSERFFLPGFKLPFDLPKLPFEFPNPFKPITDFIGGIFHKPEEPKPLGPQVPYVPFVPYVPYMQNGQNNQNGLLPNNQYPPNGQGIQSGGFSQNGQNFGQQGLYLESGLNDPYMSGGNGNFMPNH